MAIAKLLPELIWVCGFHDLWLCASAAAAAAAAPLLVPRLLLFLLVCLWLLLLLLHSGRAEQLPGDGPRLEGLAWGPMGDRLGMCQYGDTAQLCGSVHT